MGEGVSEFIDEYLTAIRMPSIRITDVIEILIISVIVMCDQ